MTRSTFPQLSENGAADLTTETSPLPKRGPSSKASPNLVVHEGRILPSWVDGISVTISLICHSSNGIVQAKAIRTYPRLARMKGNRVRKYRSMGYIQSAE